MARLIHLNNVAWNGTNKLAKILSPQIPHFALNLFGVCFLGFCLFGERDEKTINIFIQRL